MTLLKIGTDGDLVRENGSYVRIEGTDEIVQMINTRLRLFLGEAFLRQDLGTDWKGVFFGKGIRPALMRQELRDVILGTPGVVECRRVDFVTFDAGGRNLEIEWEAIAELSDLRRRVVIHDQINPIGGTTRA